MKNYKPLMPPKSIDSVQQGGTVVGAVQVESS
jgi:hypothetical protein